MNGRSIANGSWAGGFWRTVAATALYASVHSAFASRKAKQVVVATAGRRNRNGLYRVFFLAQSFGTIILLIWFVRRQPKRMLFAFYGWPAIPFRALQAGGFAWACWAAWEVGLLQILGIRPALEWLTGQANVNAEPEAQGPSEEQGRLRIAGPFRLTRHPLNFAPLIIVWSNPRMSTNLLAFNLVATAYLLDRIAAGGRKTRSGLWFGVPRLSAKPRPVLLASCPLIEIDPLVPPRARGTVRKRRSKYPNKGH